MALTNGKVTRCGLCDSTYLATELVDGMRRCRRCGALNVEQPSGAPPVPDYSDLPALTREDADHIRDLWSEEHGGLTRWQGRV